MGMGVGSGLAGVRSSLCTTLENCVLNRRGILDGRTTT